MDGSRDLYDVLGVSPHSEEVVIRAAYQALAAKYRGSGEPRDAWDERRATEIEAAYAVLRDPVSRRAYDREREGLETGGPAATPPPTPPPNRRTLETESAAGTPPPLTPPAPWRDRREQPAQSPAPPPARRTGAWLLLVAVALAIALPLAAGWVVKRARERAAETPKQGLTIRKRLADARIGPRQALPCYVDGKPVGLLRLSDCASRNGVATGPLDVGLDSPAPENRQPAPGSGQSSPAQPPSGFAGQAASASSSPEPARPPAPPPSARGAPELASQAPRGGDEALRTVQAFYDALGAGDGARAAALVIPEKRAGGPLSAAEMTRFYAALRQPLRITQIYPLDESTVFVRYRFVTRQGGHCRGAANVITVERGGQIFVRGIRAYNGC